MKKLILCLFLFSWVYSYTEDTIWIPMRDGVRLAATIYIPDTTIHPFPRPVILHRTPYNRDIDDPVILQFVCDYLGYIIISQNLRGRYDSEGEPLIFMSDGWGNLRDGFDTVEWIALQRFCNGKIGILGASAPGMTGYYCAGAHPPSLDVIVSIAASPSLYHHCIWPGGEFRKALVEEWLNRIGTPWLIDTVCNHPNYDSMWSWVDLTSRWDSAGYPMYHVTGWFDLYTDGQLEAFSELQKRFVKQKLLVGVWKQGDFGNNKVGDLVFPSNAKLDQNWALNQLLRWCHYFLYDDTTNGILDEPSVRFYLMGDCTDTTDTIYWNKWIQADTWPLPYVSYKKFYLRSGGLLDTIPPSSDEPPDTYLYDPKNPTWTIGGREYIGIPKWGPDSIYGGYGPRNQNPIESRPDVLVYSTPVLQEPLVVIGKIKVILYASSDRYDTDFAVRVTDVYPDGKSYLMTDGILMARHRHGLDREDLLTPFVPDTFEIDAWSIANVFNAGHKLRIIISSSNYPRFERNPNTGAPFRRNDTLNTLIATNVIYHNASMPSHVLLPIFPFQYLITEKNIIKREEVCFFSPSITNSLKGILNIKNGGEYQIELYDLSGRKVERILDGKLKGGIHYIESKKNLKRGNYFLMIKKNGRKIGGRKIIVIK
ncbi:MAG: CocE/NonD family hydrolase [candidate division WOR-3 bacterium]